MTYFRLHCATSCLHQFSLWDAKWEPYMRFHSPLAIMHVRLTTGDSCLIAVNHYWSADGWIHRSLKGIIESARPSRVQRPARSTFDPWFMPGFRQIAIHSDDRRFSGPAIRRFAPCLFTKKAHKHCCEADTLPFREKMEIRKVWKCEDVKAWKTRGCENDNFTIAFCLLVRYITGTFASS